MAFIQSLGHALLVIVLCGGFGTPILAQGATNSSKPHHYRTVCYTEGWAHYRPDPVQFHPEDVDTSLCTHLIFAFALLDKATGLHLVPSDPADVQMYTRLTSLKREKPNLKVMLGVGGWVMGSKEFSMMVSSEANMHSFASNAVEYLHRYNFDGLDVDWEYPADRGSPAGDKQHFTQLLQILKKEFNRDHHVSNRTRLLLSAAISPAPFRIGVSYELPAIANYVDFLNVMTYDLHGSWDSVLGHHSALYSPTEGGQDSIDYMINFILSKTVPPQKLNLGLAFYGHSLQLSDPQNTHVGAPIKGDAPGGAVGGKGVMLYYEVCKLLTDNSENITESGRLPNSQAPYVVEGSHWTGYDDVESIKEKVGYAMEHGLGGVFVWAVDMDDFHGICGGGHYPLMHAIKDQMHTAIIGR